MLSGSVFSCAVDFASCYSMDDRRGYLICIPWWFSCICIHFLVFLDVSVGFTIKIMCKISRTAFWESFSILGHDQILSLDGTLEQTQVDDVGQILP